MIFTCNPLILNSCMVFFLHIISIDSEHQLVMNLGKTYLITEEGNERLEKKS